MWRVLHLVAIAALIGSAAYVYRIKYQTILESEEIVKLKHQINRTHDEINVLHAEYEHLARPDRIHELADKMIGMQPLALNQIARPDEIPDKNVQADNLGRKLESLGLLGQSATPSVGVTGATPAVR